MIIFLSEFFPQKKSREKLAQKRKEHYFCFMCLPLQFVENTPNSLSLQHSLMQFVKFDPKKNK